MGIFRHVQPPPRLRTSEDVYHRILHDSARFDPKDIAIGCLFAELFEFGSLHPQVRHEYIPRFGDLNNLAD